MKKNGWFILSLLMAAALVLSSCTSSETTGPTAAQTVTGQVTETAQPTTGTSGTVAPAATPAVATPVVDTGPKYGGILKTMGWNATTWDPAGATAAEYTEPVVSRLLTLDWWKGPAGTNEWPFDLPGAEPPLNIFRGDLAESWEIISDTQVIYHLRQGVMWQNKPGIMAPREVTADDIVWNFKRYLETPTHNLANMTSTELYIPIALDRYTVEFTYSKPSSWLPVTGLGAYYPMVPPEVIEQYGDMFDWRNVTGSGPFMLTDYVSGSSMTYEKNPNWYLKDPEGRSMPYLDGFQVLIIPDVATRMTAMRSSQLDLIGGYAAVGWQDAEGLSQTNPELEYLTKKAATIVLLQFDLRNPPFGPSDDPNAKMVRRAASMAIDRQSIVENFYQGNGAIITTNTAIETYGVEELALDNLPASSRELFEYNPDEARRLLAEAGYPNGIKTTLRVLGGDVFSIIKDMWDDVGIETELYVMQYAAMLGMQWAHTTTDVFQVYWGYGLETGWRFFQRGYEWSPGNFNGVNDPELNALYEEMLIEGPFMDYDDRVDMYTAMVLEAIDGAYEVILPVEQTYNFWQPWVKGFHGEDHVGIGGVREVAAYIWIDEDLR